jgi:hypothetical protein
MPFPEQRPLPCTQHYSQFKAPGVDLQDKDHNRRFSTHHLQIDGERHAVSGTNDAYSPTAQLSLHQGSTVISYRVMPWVLVITVLQLLC